MIWGLGSLVRSLGHVNSKPVLLVAEWRLKREPECGHGSGGSGGVGAMAASQPRRSRRWATGAPRCRPLAPELDRQPQNSITIPFFGGRCYGGAVPISGPDSGPDFGTGIRSPNHIPSGGPDSGPKIGTGIRSRNQDRNLVNSSNFPKIPVPESGPESGPESDPGIGTGIEKYWLPVPESGPDSNIYFFKGE